MHLFAHHNNTQIANCIDELCKQLMTTHSQLFYLYLWAGSFSAGSPLYDALGLLILLLLRRRRMLCPTKGDDILNLDSQSQDKTHKGRDSIRLGSPLENALYRLDHNTGTRGSIALFSWPTSILDAIFIVFIALSKSICGASSQVISTTSIV